MGSRVVTGTSYDRPTHHFQGYQGSIPLLLPFFLFLSHLKSQRFLLFLLFHNHLLLLPIVDLTPIPHRRQACDTVGKSDDSDSLQLHIQPSQAHHGQEPEDRHNRPVLLRHGCLQPCQEEWPPVVGVFTIPDKNGREDPLAIAASADGVPVFKFKSWRLKGVARPEVLAEYKSVGADLNVMPYCSQFIPMEVVNAPSLKSICIAAGRLFVEETKKMTIGDPLDRSVQHGPQDHLAHMNKLVEFCETGVKEGARLVLGGKRNNRPGLFMEPTIFCDVEDDMYLAKEESFGPIICISKFDAGDVEGVVKRANNTEYGLASGVFTKDVNKALYVSEHLDAGTCFVNVYNKTDVATPFGGFKESGFGKDLGREALNEFLKTKTITFEYSL